VARQIGSSKKILHPHELRSKAPRNKPMMTPDRDTPFSSPDPIRQLCAADGEVVDAMLQEAGSGHSGHDSDAASAALVASERGQRVSNLLGLLNHLPAESPAEDLVARTMARIAVARSAASESTSQGSSNQQKYVAAGQTDFDVLDALLESGARGDMSAARAITQTERGHRVSKWLDLIDQMPAQPPADDLVARTMSRIAVRGRREAVLARIDEHRPAAMELSPTGTDGRATGRASMPAIAFRWNELIAVAAVLMIAVSLLWPIMAQTRTDAMRIACANNLATASVGLRNYAWDNQNTLPRYSTIAGSPWWNVGQPVSDGVVQSNSAHLYKLRREGYVATGTLNCPTNGQAPQQLAASAFDWPNARAISYSYQNQYTPEPTRLNRTNSIVVLADKNPLFTPGVEGSASLMFNSEHGIDSPGRRHSKVGQNVLVLDGSVQWAPTNAINGDNFYAAGNITSYRGTETPANQNDSFVVP